MEQIHGHEVMQMMMRSEKAYTRETLSREVAEKFGSDARFYTCSADNMTAEELINFLEQKGKFVGGAGGFRTDPDKMCNH